MRYIAELERKVQTLQTEAPTLSAQLSLLQRDTTELTAANNELKLRLQTMEQQIHFQDVDFDAACPPTASPEISDVQFDKDCNGIVHITQDQNSVTGVDDENNNGDASYVFVEQSSQDLDNHLQIQQSQTHLLSSFEGEGEGGFHYANGVDNAFYKVVEEDAPPSMPLGGPQSLTNPNNTFAQLQFSAKEKEENTDEHDATPVQNHHESHVHAVGLSNGDAKKDSQDSYHQTDVPHDAPQSKSIDLHECEEKVQLPDAALSNEEDDVNNVRSNEEEGTNSFHSNEGEDTNGFQTNEDTYGFHANEGEDTNDFHTNEEEKVGYLSIAPSNEVQFGGADNKLEEQSEMDSSVVNTGEDPDSENVISDIVGTQVYCLSNGKEWGELIVEAVVHNPKEELVRENRLNVDVAAFSSDAHQVNSEAMDGFNVNGVHLESEPMDWDDKDETNIPARETASDIEVTHNLEEVHEVPGTSDTSQTESEYKLVNESFENCTISAHPVAAVKQIIMFGDISAEYDNTFHTPAKFSAIEPAVRDLSVERVETVSGDEESPLSEVSAPNSENASESVNSSIDVQDEGDESVSGSSDVKEVLEKVEVVGGCKSQPSPLENASKSVHYSVDVQYEGDQSVCGDSGAKEILEEIEGNKSRPSPTESTSIHQPEGQKVEKEVVNGPLYLIRIPYLGDKFTNEINLAKLQVDEKTRSRETIRLAIRSKKDTCSDCLAKFEAAKSEERAARDAFNAKRDEMDSIQTEINSMKNAASIDDIDERIHNMEHRIEHETVTLKEEKQLLRDMKQLKNQREQLRASLSKKVEVPPTSEERDKIDEQLKILKQQLNVARKEMLQAEGVTRETRKKYFDEENKLQELKGQFRAADDVRQEAYSHFQNLKKQLYDKNKYFWKYKEDQRKSRDLRGDTLQQLCVNQVESIMDLWNKNDEFRNEYVRCNVNSTLWRLGTLDGRRLGPDEKPHVLYTAVQGKVDNAVVVSEDTNSTSLCTLGAQVGDVNSVVKSEHENPKENIKSVINLEQSASTKSKKAAKPIAPNIASVSGSDREGIDEKAEVNKRTLEDEELARKEEELRKEEIAAKLKELRRSKEMAKAKEANERKKRNALKAQARAELRTQKEAELKEKEKEKRARKKEKKRAAGVELANGGAEGEPASSAEIDQAEITTENEVEEKTSTSVAKRHQKPSLLVKQTRPLPAPLRNRGRRRMQPWMWVLLILLAVCVLFLVGSSGYLHKFSKSRFGF